MRDECLGIRMRVERGVVLAWLVLAEPEEISVSISFPTVITNFRALKK